mgnify:CR=1 FL=1
MWMYKPKNEHLEDVKNLCEHISAYMYSEVVEMLGKPLGIVCHTDYIMELYKKYEMTEKVKWNLDELLILTKEQYEFLGEHEQNVKHWFDALKVVE